MVSLLRRNFGLDSLASGMDRADCLEQFFADISFQQLTPRDRLDRP